MKKSLSLVVALFCIYAAIGQKKFESGYYIGNDGKRVEGFIQVVDFERLNSGNGVLEYRSAADGKSENIEVQQITEVAIGSDMKFRKYTVELDDANLHQVTTYNKYPEFLIKTVFLNILIEGDASLYAFDSGSGIKYFYQVAGKTEKPQQLIYKKFIFSRLEAPRENAGFRQQLSDNLSCSNDKFSKFAKIDYTKSELLPLFEAYNACSNSIAQVFKNEKKNRLKLLFSLFAGAYSTGVEVDNLDPKPEDLSETTLGYGGELELLTPVQRWGIVARAEFENFETGTTTTRTIPGSPSIRTDKYELEVKSFMFSFGARYHFNRASKHGFSIDALAGSFFPSGTFSRNGVITNPNIPGSGTPFNEGVVKTESGFFGTVGFSYVFSGHFGIAIRYDSPKKLIDKASLKVTQSRVGLNLSYSF